jgi:Ca2+-binding RTX toxin-like protein
MSDPAFQVWTTGDQEGIPQRPTFVGDFGLTYTSLVNFEETANKFEYNQFSLEPNTDNLGFNESEDHKIFYVKGDHDPNTNKQLTITIEHGEHSHSGEDSGEQSEEEPEIYTLEENSYFFVAPDNSYSIANGGTDSVEALSITIPQNPETAIDEVDYDALFPSPLIPPSDNEPEPNQTINLTNGNDYFNELGDNPDTYRIFFDVAPGYSDHYLNPVTINGVEYQGTFETLTTNPSTGQVVTDSGFFKFVSGSFEELVEHNFEGGVILEILRSDYLQSAIDMGKNERVGVITQVYFDSNQETTTIPDVIETLPSDTQGWISELSKSNPLPENGYTPLPFEDPNRYDNPYDFLVIPAFEFAFDVFRDKPKAEGGLPIPIVGGDLNGDGVGWTAEGYESRRVINALDGNDTVFANKEDTVYGADGDDVLNASGGKGGNQLYGEDGNDRILVNFNDRAFGADGNDTIDASKGVGLDGLDDKGRNLLDGGEGNDILKASSNNELWGGAGKDRLEIGNGGNNLLYGGEGKDQFTILSGVLPETVPVEYSDFAKSLLPPGLSFPDLVDTKNTIMDFELGVDKIYIQGFTSDDGKVSVTPKSFEALQLLPTFGDLYSTSIIAKFTDNGVEKEISLGNVKGIIFNEFTANDFVIIDKFLVGTAADETLTGAENNDLIRGKDGNDQIVGNAGNDSLNGGNGNDNLTGGSGSDFLWGGEGEDQFIFASPTEGVDTIKSFNPEDDTIVVSASGFGGGLVSGGTIESDQLVLGSSSVDANSRFLYDSSSGKLFFDSDGNGTTEPVLLAKLGSGKVVDHTDIFVAA